MHEVIEACYHVFKEGFDVFQLYCEYVLGGSNPEIGVKNPKMYV